MRALKNNESYQITHVDNAGALQLNGTTNDLTDAFIIFYESFDYDTYWSQYNYEWKKSIESLIYKCKISPRQYKIEIVSI